MLTKKQVKTIHIAGSMDTLLEEILVEHARNLGEELNLQNEKDIDFAINLYRQGFFGTEIKKAIRVAKTQLELYY